MKAFLAIFICAFLWLTACAPEDQKTSAGNDPRQGCGVNCERKPGDAQPWLGAFKSYLLNPNDLSNTLFATATLANGQFTSSYESNPNHFRVGDFVITPDAGNGCHIYWEGNPTGTSNVLAVTLPSAQLAKAFAVLVTTDVEYRICEVTSTGLVCSSAEAQMPGTDVEYKSLVWGLTISGAAFMSIGLGRDIQLFENQLKDFTVTYDGVYSQFQVSGCSRRLSI